MLVSGERLDRGAALFFLFLPLQGEIPRMRERGCEGGGVRTH